MEKSTQQPNREVPLENQVKYLGVTINKHLRFAKHVELVCNEANGTVKALLEDGWPDAQQAGLAGCSGAICGAICGTCVGTHHEVSDIWSHNE